MSNSFFKFCYFASATVWGYIVLKDKEYLPWLLGGSGEYSRSITPKYFPYAQRDKNDGLKHYILVTSGFHVCNAFTHFVETKKNDFIEMGLHHIVALYLFGGLYFFNLWEGGATIAYLHDIADIFIAASRMLGDSKYSNLTGVMFVVAMGVWFWTRLITLPYLMYLISQSTHKYGTCLKEIFLYLLGCMFALHTYWFTMFVNILTKFITTGKAEDTMNKIEKQSKQE